jgi:hypothetical protein
VNVTNHTGPLVDVLLEVNRRFADSYFHSVNAKRFPRNIRLQESQGENLVKHFEEIEESGSLFFDASSFLFRRRKFLEAVIMIRFGYRSRIRGQCCTVRASSPYRRPKTIENCGVVAWPVNENVFIDLAR